MAKGRARDGLQGSKRIAVIGISGSGKSVFARNLAIKTGLPLFHMDRLFWKGNWQAVPEVEYLAQHRQLIAEETWIIEGYVDQAMAGRLSSADLVIYLDYPGYLCAWRVIRRWFLHRKTSRPELPDEARERFSLPFIWLVLTGGERPDIERALEHSQTGRATRLCSRRDAQTWLDSVSGAGLRLKD